MGLVKIFHAKQINSRKILSYPQIPRHNNAQKSSYCITAAIVV